MSKNIGCFAAVAIWAFVAILFAAPTFWTDRTLDCWCSYFAHHAVDVPTWLSFLVTIIGNGLTLALNVISEIVRLVMGI